MNRNVIVLLGAVVVLLLSSLGVAYATSFNGFNGAQNAPAASSATAGGCCGAGQSAGAGSVAGGCCGAVVN